MKRVKLLMLLFPFLILNACNKEQFLNKKPSTAIVQPKTLSDFQLLLENTESINITGGLAQIASDEYEVNYTAWQTLSATERNSYIWAKDIYAGDKNIRDWNDLYTSIFYANSVLDGLSKSDSLNAAQGKFIKGWALFIRAYAMYDLTRNFCSVYDASSVDKDLGIPLRLNSGIDEVKQRSTLKQTYDQIFADLNESCTLLPSVRPSAQLNRPSKLAVYGLFSRIYLDRREYSIAEKYADSCLSLYDKIIDYNLIDPAGFRPFSVMNEELIYNTKMVRYPVAIEMSFSPGKIPFELISLYQPNDLRLPLYYESSNGVVTKRSGYYGFDFNLYPFSGLATDEIYLIKAECLARREQVDAAMNILNELLINRYSNLNSYVPVTASSSADALAKILLERRKELTWRGLRWQDLKRLNKEGANIKLTRILNGIEYTLPPNSPLYVFPIPDEEILLSGIKQNLR